jgi:hypothetical protein
VIDIAVIFVEWWLSFWAAARQLWR